MGLRILKPGLFCSLQDQGRRGYQAQGVPIGGAMDRRSSRKANLLCGNNAQAPVLECAWHGAQFLLEADRLMSYCGAGAVVHINGEAAPAGRPLFVPAYSLISIEASDAGFYTYLAVAGGFKARLQLGSCSTYVPAALGGLNGKALAGGEYLCFGDADADYLTKLAQNMIVQEGSFSTTAWGIEEESALSVVRVAPGPEQDWVTAESLRDFFEIDLKLSTQSNRMGLRIEGFNPAWKHRMEMLSTAVSRGTIQVSPDGTLLMLMADAQTTGGYPRIAQVVDADLSGAAQLRPGSRLRFSQISWEEAEELYLSEEEHMKQIAQAIDMKVRFRQ